MRRFAAEYLNKNAVDYSALGARAIGAEAREFADTINANLMVAGANLDSAAKIQAEEHWKDVQGEMAQKQANTNLLGSAISGAGQIGLGAISRFGGGWKDASSIGFPGNQVNSDGRLRY